GQARTVHGKTDVAEQNPIHVDTFDDRPHAVVEEERDAGVDAPGNDELRHGEIGGNFVDLAGIDVLHLGHDAPLPLDRALELQAEPLAVKVGELPDPGAFRENDGGQAGLENHGRGYDRQGARIGQHRLIGRGVAEIDIVGADELDG